MSVPQWWKIDGHNTSLPQSNYMQKLLTFVQMDDLEVIVTLPLLIHTFDDHIEYILVDMEHPLAFVDYVQNIDILSNKDLCKLVLKLHHPLGS